jgi:DNA-binding NarL/FixJ family response regulator
LTSRAIISALIVANSKDAREKLVQNIDNDPRITVIASVPIADASNAIEQLTPALIVAHSNTENESMALHPLAKKYSHIFFILIISDVLTSLTNGESINYLATIPGNNIDNIDHVIPKIISVAKQSIVKHAASNETLNDQARLIVLTKKELEILKLTAEGLKIDTIAEQLHRSPSTIAKHRENMMKKLHMHDRVALTRLAIREGLVSA